MMGKSISLTAASLFGLAAFLVGTGRRVERPTPLVRRFEAGPSRTASPYVTEVKGAPKAEIAVKHYDFGLMGPLELGEHRFAIHNGGQSPLVLSEGPTTCKCTVAKLPSRPIAPGDTGYVRLQWNTGRNSPRYSQSATIYTNDPLRRALQLSVEGDVKVQIGFQPARIVLPAIEPDRSASGETIVYSHVWRDFMIRDVNSSIPGLRWEATPADSASLRKTGGLCAVKLRVTTPRDTPQGFFQDLLQVRIEPSGEPESVVTRQIALEGKVLRRLSVYGRAIDASGLVNLGVVPQGKGAQAVLLLKMRDAERRFTVRRIETTPSFVQARVETMGPDADRRGLRRLVIQLPADAPPCCHTGPALGEVKLELEHPRIQKLVLPLRLAVKERMVD